MRNEPQNPPQEYKPYPVHPMSAVSLMILDSIWTIPEAIATPTVVGLIVLCFLLGGVTWAGVTLIEKNINHKPLGEAAATAFMVALAAAVPYPVTGTGAGALLLGWAGLRKLRG